MPRKCRSQTLDVNLDFARPRSMTLSAEELRRIPSPKRHSDPTLEEKIHMNIRNVGICRGLTKLRKVFGGEENPYQHTINKDQEKPLEHSEQGRSCNIKPSISQIEGSQLPCYCKKKHEPHGLELGFSPQTSMNTMPSPSMHAYLSTPEYPHSELGSSDDELSDISSPVSSLVLGPRRDYGSTSPSNLRRTPIKPHIFQVRNGSGDINDDDDDDEYDRKELQEQIEMAIEELKN